MLCRHKGLALLLLAALFVSTAAFAASPIDKLDPQLRILLSGEAAGKPGVPGLDRPDEMVEVLIKGDLSRDLLSQYGVVTETMISGIATARIPASAVLALAGSSRVQFIQQSREMQYHFDTADVEPDQTVGTGLTPEARAGSTTISAAPPPADYTGNGIVVGIVDTGIDLNHADFRNSNGTTRIRYLWDQTGGGTPPSGFTYGREWTANDINAGTAIEYDFDGHGTHIAGDAAGNGRATGNGQPQYVYTGLATESDIVFVKLALVTDARILDAVSYVFQKATSMGKDAVVCLGVGSHYGPHDGSTLLETGLDAMSGPGRIIVASAGNDGNTKVHAACQYKLLQDGEVSMTIPAYVLSGGESVQLSGWYDATPGVYLTLIGPSGQHYGPITHNGLLGINSPDGNITISTSSSPDGAAQQFYISLSNGSPARLAAGEWRMHVTTPNTFTQRMDFWIVYSRLANSTPYMNLGESGMVCVTSPATADRVIAVGAYTVKKSWQLPSGTTLSYSQAVMNDIANFSSMGPRRDGVTKPDICASGFGTASSRSATATISSIYIVEDGVHCMMTGTSVSAAVVTGAIATLLDQFPGLTPEDARNILRVRAQRDAYTDDPENLARWGAGKLSLAEISVSGVDPGTPRVPDALTMRSPFPNPTHDVSRLSVDVAEGSGDLHVGVYDVQGHLVRLLHAGQAAAGEHEFVWDGTDENARPVASGSYYVVASDRTGKASRAIVLTR